MWWQDAVLYHVYALGACAAPRRNDRVSPPVPRLDRLLPELDRLADLGITALLVGPVFEATSHGYDTIDYLAVDRRLGDHATLERLSAELAARGIRLVLDAVLNHVGRDFWAFRDVLDRGASSPYADWFHLDFTRGNRWGDPFSYAGWSGSRTLVSLNLDNPRVRAYLLGVVDAWITRYGVSGLRLDAANVMSPDFLAELAAHVRARHGQVCLVGEIVHGDYRALAGGPMLDSATNYWAHHALWTAHHDHDYRVLADCLDRQFGPHGQYQGLPLMNFADNHDVTRVASRVGSPAALYPLYGILATMPGVPALYYGSEWGTPGVHRPGQDAVVRPALDLLPRSEADLPAALRRLFAVRRALPALRHGGYRARHVAARQLAFSRPHPDGEVVVAVNDDDQWAPVPVGPLGRAWDHLEGAPVECREAAVWVPPRWLRILTPT